MSTDLYWQSSHIVNHSATVNQSGQQNAARWHKVAADGSSGQSPIFSTGCPAEVQQRHQEIGPVAPCQVTRDRCSITLTKHLISNPVRCGYHPLLATSLLPCCLFLINCNLSSRFSYDVISEKPHKKLIMSRLPAHVDGKFHGASTRCVSYHFWTELRFNGHFVTSRWAYFGLL